MSTRRAAGLLLSLIALLAWGVPAGAATNPSKARKAKRPAACLVAKKPATAKKAKARRCPAKKRAVAVKQPAARKPALPAAPVPTGGASAPVPANPPAPGPAPAPAPAAPASAPATSAPAAPAPAPAGALQVGLNVNAKAWGADAGRPLDRALPLGIGWVREELEWADVEATQGVFDWTRYDQLLAAASRRGVRVLLMPTSPPAWAGPAWNAFPDDVDAYGRFVARVVGRYGPHGTFWTAHPSLPKVPVTHLEVWNEPYEPFFSAGGLDPATYAQLVRAAARHGRAVDASVKYLLGATPYAKGLPEVWTEALYAAMPDLNAWFDAVAVHPYGKDLTSRDAQWRRTFEDVRATLVQHGAADKPLWATEMGWSTCTADATWCVSEAEQARLLRTALTTIRASYGGVVEAVFPYHLQDQFGTHDPAASEPFFGLLRNDWSPKPAAGVLAAFTAQR